MSEIGCWRSEACNWCGALNEEEACCEGEEGSESCSRSEGYDELTPYERKLEKDVENLQNMLFAMTSHYAKIQFRLRQISTAPPCERQRLLRELERVACQGIEAATMKDTLPNLGCDMRSMGNIRTKQREIITALRSNLKKLNDTDLIGFGNDDDDRRVCPCQFELDDETLTAESSRCISNPCQRIDNLLSPCCEESSLRLRPSECICSEEDLRTLCPRPMRMKGKGYMSKSDLRSTSSVRKDKTELLSMDGIKTIKTQRPSSGSSKYDKRPGGGEMMKYQLISDQTDGTQGKPRRKSQKLRRLKGSSYSAGPFAGKISLPPQFIYRMAPVTTERLTMNRMEMKRERSTKTVKTSKRRQRIKNLKSKDQLSNPFSDFSLSTPSHASQYTLYRLAPPPATIKTRKKNDFPNFRPHMSVGHTFPKILFTTVLDQQFAEAFNDSL